MRKLFERRKKNNPAGALPGRENQPGQDTTWQVNFDKIDNYILGKYGLSGLQGKKKKEIFMLLNILFLVCGVITVVIFLYSGFNIADITGAILTVAIGVAITHMITRYGVRKEEDQIEKRRLKNEKPKENQ